jgi:hypothetical protein
MHDNQILHFRRLGLLMRNTLVINAKMIFISLIAIVGLLSVYVSHSPFLPLILLIGGLWLSSLSFYELHNPQRNYHLLTLPASQLEKVLSRWLFTALVFPAVVLAIYCLLYFFINGMKLSPFPYYIVDLMKNYLKIQAIFFLGSVYFKKYTLIKTIAAATFIGLVLSAYLLILGFIFHLSPLPLRHLSQSAWFVLPLYCWALSFIRFTESEIN